MLRGLSNCLNLSLDAALQINKEIFRKRFEQFVEKNSFMDAEEIDLNKLRLFLCIKKEIVHNFKRELCGHLYGKTIESFFKLGIYSISLMNRQTVRKRKFELRLNDDIAKDILYNEARKIFMQFVSTYRNKTKHHNAVKELRNIIHFSSYIVSPILIDGQRNENTKISNIFLKEFLLVV